MRVILLLLIVPAFTMAGQSVNTGTVKIDLHAERSSAIWTAENSNKSISVPATVPGGIYSDLEAANIFSTPIYYRYNDLDTRWVGRENWTFSRQFEVTHALLAKSKVVMVCDGLDTIAEVFINDQKVGFSDNMFSRYVFDVKSALQVGINTITVAFESPVLWARREFEDHNSTHGYYVMPMSLVPEYRGENHAQMIRKTQASFSWDWGPSYPSSGIWKDIYIEGFSGAVIRDVLIFMDVNKSPPDETVDTQWTVNVQTFVDSATPEINGVVTVELTTEGGEIIRAEQQVSSLSRDLNVTVSTTVGGDKVKLWWPNGFGDHPLYNLKVKFRPSGGINEESTRDLRVGFRTIIFDESQISPANASLGNNFQFFVNGVPIYSKGSNSIPFHALPERVTRETYEWAFISAKHTHMNMIRVWGGGMYEYDDYYDLADEYGIMIWEDFMFACAMYPATPGFLERVKKEVETQVKRLQYHTSVVIWATNNENEAALRGNWYGTAHDYPTYEADYVKLYIDTIIPLVNELDPSRECLPSSPTNGKQSLIEGGVAENPYSAIYGDVHVYDYYSDGWDYKQYRKTRYVSEYGFQAFPSHATLEEFTDKNVDWRWFSDAIEHRQRHPLGQGEIFDQIRQHLPLREDASENSGFVAMLYMAQVTQSMSVKAETELYRRLKRELTPEGVQNFGALYWQLNDVWPGCSWAGIEFNGRWKMMHYYGKTFFAPTMVSPYIDEDGKTVVIDAITDDPSTFTGQLRVRLYNLASLTPLFEETVSVSLNAFQAKEVHRIDPEENDDLKSCENSMTPCLLYLTMDGVPDNFIFLRYPTQAADVPNPNLTLGTISISPDDPNTFNFEVRVDAVAPFVFLNVNDNTNRGYFSDNGFVMVEATKQISYTSWKPYTLRDFARNLEVVSLHSVT